MAYHFLVGPRSSCRTGYRERHSASEIEVVVKKFMSTRVGHPVSTTVLLGFWFMVAAGWASASGDTKSWLD
jgi:hypothetical protein